MALRLRVLDIAEHELDAAAAHYEAEWPGIGTRFVRAYAGRLAVALQLPRTGRLLARFADCEMRAFLVGDGFPYSIYSALFTDELVVLAVSHQHREPGYWIDRLRDVR